jgi:hypothetical protein
MKTICLVLFVIITTAVSALADIQVTYTGFTAEQQTAFENASSLWEPILNSSVPIKVNARQQNIPGFVSIVIPNLIRNFTGAPQTNIWYPTTLANALTGTELNAGEADIDIIINPTMSWYYGLEPSCPANQIDFVSEVHKGISYGLGYMSSFYVTSGMGTYGMLDPSVLGLTTSFPWEAMQGQPTLYDTFVLNTSGQYLCDTQIFANPSAALMNQLTGGQLRWHGDLADQYAGGTQPVLYASAYNLARTARLSADTYLGTENAPGIPTAYNGSCYRYPAPIVLGMLRDQGWDLDFSTLLNPPQALYGYAEYQNVILAWNAPQTEYDVLQYRVYRDDVLMGTTNSASYNDLNVPWGPHDYTVTAVFSIGESGPSNTANVLVGSANDDPSQVPPLGLKISAAPNPFRASLSIDVSCEARSGIRVAVYDLRGRCVTELCDGVSASEGLRLVWDGKDSAGRDTTPGIYFIMAGSNTGTEVLKVLRTR